ncbi:hypothetical protein TRIP_C20989 [Candidatus Zixiibacteriota bacterium]|nr:hypothetical protein TRIP_C20989 [candidate division Zixibacteria bacterium]
MSDLNLYSVNWQDGMLITRQHLKDQEKYFEDLIRWHHLDVGDRYGLVKKSFDGKAALALNSLVSGNRLRVEMLRCQAVTPDGTYINIQESGQNPVRADFSISGAAVPVFISVDASGKQPVGDPDPGEDLPRVPYMVNGYAIHLGAPPNLPDGSFLQVAELLINGSEVKPSPNYFPPCLSVGADEQLAAKVSDFRNRLENLLSLSSRAYMAVSATGALAGESTNLQVAFKETTYLLVYHLAATIDDFVVGRNAIHPMHLVIQFKKLFRIFSTLMNLQPGLKDYLNEKFFSKELNSEIGRFMAAVDNFILAEYNHRQLGGHIQAIDNLLNILRGAIGFLAQTKREQLGEQAVATDSLTYQGRTYRVSPFSSTRLEQIGELSYLMVDVASPRAVADSVVLMSKDLFSVAEWNNMQVRLGLNDARGLGETDPVDVDVTTFGNKVALHPRDMMRSSAVRQITLIFRGARDNTKFQNLGKMDLIIYTM